jgi:hypothetical protein
MSGDLLGLMMDQYMTPMPGAMFTDHPVALITLEDLPVIIIIMDR